MLSSPIRVLLIEASPLALQAQQKMLAPSAEIEVVGTASTCRAGLTKTLALKPNVVCLSTQLLDALELVHDVMSQCPCPILVLRNAGESGKHLLEAGAVDEWTKPTAHWSVNEILAADLVAKVKRLAKVPVISRVKARDRNVPPPKTLHKPEKVVLSPTRGPLPGREPLPRFPTALTAPIASALWESPRIVAVGASTGGPHALVSLFSNLPRDYPYPLLCVQHISKGFLKELVDWLDASCALKVKIANAGEVPQPGMVYFGEEDRHLELDSRGRIWFSTSPPVDGHRPSVTALFQSVARSRGKNAIAVLLTGMGSDGAKGMLAIAEAGGVTIAQEESSCVVFGMPKEAIALGAAQHVMTPPDIARKLQALAAQPQ